MSDYSRRAFLLKAFGWAGSLAVLWAAAGCDGADPTAEAAQADPNPEGESDDPQTDPDPNPNPPDDPPPGYDY